MCCSAVASSDAREPLKPAKSDWEGQERRGSGQWRHLEGGRALLQVLLPPGTKGAAGDLLNLALADEALAVPLYVGLLRGAQQQPVMVS